uniref:Uncharacterized protein n=1 Tax=Panagrolaimus superbus TaxID=310955 RepID=A0A914XWW6_9BILA
MFHKIDFVQKAQLSLQSETTVKFAENLQFACSKFDTWSYSYHIKDIKGDFVITRIARVFSDGTMWDNGYDKAKNFFGSDSVSLNHIFYITANIEMNEMVEEMCAVPYQLQIPFFRLKPLQLRHFYNAEIVLPGYDGLKFTYYVMKTKANIVEIYIKNPYDLHIQGKKDKCRKQTNINICYFFS